MSHVDDQPDDLQKLWQKTGEQSGKENHSMLLRLVKEKQTSLLDVLREQNMTAYMISLSFAPLTAIAAWIIRRYSVWMLSGYLLMTITLVVGAVVVWLSARKGNATGKIDLSMREHQQQLMQLYDNRVAFSKSIKYWYATPLFLGAGLVLYPVTVHLLGRMWGSVVVAGLLLICWIGVWHMHDVRAVADLRRRREEVRQLLDEMGRC
jgi:hypothetical protein